MALVGHYRIAVDDAKIQFGLPEITLGLIPGASGITKMTRLLGLMGAQPYILESRLFNPHEALELAWCRSSSPMRRHCVPRRWPGSRCMRARPHRLTTPGTTRITKCPAARRPPPSLPRH